MYSNNTEYLTCHQLIQDNLYRSVGAVRETCDAEVVRSRLLTYGVGYQLLDKVVRTLLLRPTKP